MDKRITRTLAGKKKVNPFLGNKEKKKKIEANIPNKDKEMISRIVASAIG